jgi:hypothetical protein
MRTRSTTRGLDCLALAACLALWLAGCGFQSSPVVTKSANATVTWAKNDASGVAGIDFAGVNVDLYERPILGETVVLVWAGFHPVQWESGGQGGVSDGRDTFRANSMMESIVPGKRIQCEVTFHRDDPGTLTMGDERFDLSHGTLFLVSLAKGKPVIRQLKRNWSGAQLSESALKEAARNDSEINRFFKGEAAK